MESHITISASSPWDKPQGDTENPFVVPVGLNFGPTSVSTVFYFNESIYFTGLPCGEIYKSFFQVALSSNVQCNLDHRPSAYLSTSTLSPLTSQNVCPKIMDTFSNAIQNATGMGHAALDKDPALKFKVMAITVPDHWGESARSCVATAARTAGYSLDGSHMIVPLSRAIQSARGMTRRTKGIYYTLLLDYNKSYLHFMLVEMCGTECVMKGQAYFPHLGEDQLHKAPILASAVSSSQETLDHNSIDKTSSDDLPTSNRPDKYNSTSDHSITNHSPIDDSSSDHANDNSAAVPDEFLTQRIVCHNQAAHYKPILDTLAKFMVLMTKSEAASSAAEPPIVSHTAKDVSHAVRVVKYIMVDGEASFAGLDDLREAIKEKFVNEERITVEGRRPDCGAYGAAIAAQRQMGNPQHLGDWKDLPSYVSGPVP